MALAFSLLASSGCAQQKKRDPMVVIMETAAKEICACTDIACADKADRASAEKARPFMADKSYKPSPEIKAQVSALIAEGRACKDKLRPPE